MSEKQRAVLVTGASRGIGKAIALELARAGFLVTGTATSQEGANAILDWLAPYQGRGVVLNVNEAGQCDAVVDELVRSCGGIYGLVNNAGITRDNLALRMKDDEWGAVLDTNLSAAFRLSRAVLRPMMKAKGGRIVNITSVIGALGNAGQINYSAAKAGLAGMTRALAQEIGSRNITVNCVAPGFIDTDMTKALGAEQAEQLTQRIPLGRLGSPDDIAQAVSFLLSSGASYITGTTLHVNGGMFMA